MDPLEMKYSAEIRSPAWTRVSPGGAWVVLNLMASALRQPLVDPKDQNDKACCQHAGRAGIFLIFFLAYFKHGRTPTVFFSLLISLQDH